MQFSQETKELIKEYKLWKKSLEIDESLSYIEVDEVVSKIARVYEKMKATVSWQFEHLLRKNAIGRTLKRIIFVSDDVLEIENKAKSLIVELIRGGYLPNNRIPKFKIEEIKKLFTKYLFLIKNISKNQKKEDFLMDWLVEIMACDIQDTLWPAFTIRENALINFATKSLNEKISYEAEEIKDKGEKLTEEEKYIQIYIANQKSLFDFDEAIITYNLFKKRCPEFFLIFDPEDTGDKNRIKNISDNIYKIWKDINNDLNHKLGPKFYAITERYDTPYLILGDIINENINKEGTMEEDFYLLENSIINAYEKRYKTLSSRLLRIATLSTISIFFSNILSYMILEYPLTVYVFNQEFTLFNIIINILGPTLLMFLLVATVKLPSKENLQVVILKTTNLVYQNEGQKEKYFLEPFRKRHFFYDLFFLLLHVLLCFVSYGLIIYLLTKIEMPIPAIITFIIFVSIIVFTGIAIRKRAKEISLEQDKKTFFSFILNMFSFPVAQIGKWLANKWKRYNLYIIFSILVDLPFNTFLNILEEWTGYIKEQKEKT